MAEHVDVLVIGAGPAGSSAARGCAARGLGRVVVVDKAVFPRTKVCAGGLSPRAIEHLRREGLWDLIGTDAYRIRGLRLTSPDGRKAAFVGSDAAAVLPRRRLDQLLLDAAVAAGAELRAGLRVAALLRDGDRVVGARTEAGEIRARWVINAGGANARLGTRPAGRVLLHTCMAWYDGLEFTPNLVEMIFDPAIEPHYAWLFPESETRVNIGFCIDADRRRGSVRDIFAGLLDRHFADRLPAATQFGRWRSHPIAASLGVNLSPPPGLLPVGEAAALVNVATGEGIAYAMESGAIAAREIARGERRGLGAARIAREYRDACRFAFTLGLRGGDVFRRKGYRLLDRVTGFGSSWLMRRAANEAMRVATS